MQLQKKILKYEGEKKIIKASIVDNNTDTDTFRNIFF